MSTQQLESSIANGNRSVDITHSDDRIDWFLLVTWGTCAAALTFILGPLLIRYGEQLWSLDHYQFTPVLLLAASWLAWNRSKEPIPIGVHSPFFNVTFRVLGWGICAILTTMAVVFQSPMISFVATMCLTVLGVFEWGGWSAVRHYLPIWGVLLLAIRPPFNWDNSVIVSMQHLVTSWGSGVLDYFNFRHLSSGVVIRMPEQEFFVAEACSGVHSLFAALAFIAVYCAMTGRGPLRVIFLLAAAVFWVIVANILRILAVVILSTKYHLPVVEGIGHEMLGFAVFAIVILAVLSTDRMLLFIVPLRLSLPTLVTTDSVWNGEGYAARQRNRATVWASLLATGFVGLAVGTQFLPSTHAAPTSALVSESGLVDVPESVLPERWNGWGRTNFEFRENTYEFQGDFSRIWTYQKGPLNVSVSIDGPFTEWHDTEYCYRGLGFETLQKQDYPTPQDETNSGRFTELSIVNNREQHAYVLFMAYSESGKALAPSRSQAWARLRDIWRNGLGKEDFVEHGYGKVFQVQILAQRQGEMSPVEQDEAKALFHEMRKRIVTYVSDSN